MSILLNAGGVVLSAIALAVAKRMGMYSGVHAGSKDCGYDYRTGVAVVAEAQHIMHVLTEEDRESIRRACALGDD